MIVCVVAVSVLLSGASTPIRVRAVRVDAPGSDVARLKKYIGIRPDSLLDLEAVRHAVELLFATGEFADVVVRQETAPGGVVLVFQPVPAPRLVRVVVEGDTPLSSGKLRDVARLRRGESLWPERALRAAKDAERALSERGYLNARVEVSVRQQPEGAVAVFHVNAGPRVIVGACRTVGAPQTLASTLAREMRPRVGQIYERRRARQATEKMAQRSREAGYWRARVTPRENLGPRRRRMELIFEVEPGPLVDVRFAGAELKPSLRRQLVRLLRDGRLTQDVLEEVTERIEDDFRRRGFSSVSVSHTQEHAVNDLLVTFTIEPGEMKRLAMVRIADAPAGLESLVSSSVGDPFVERRLEEDAQRIELALEEAGYPHASVALDITDQLHGVMAVFQTDSGPRVVVGSVSIEAPKSVSDATKLDLTPGAPFRASDVARARDALVRAYRNEGHIRVAVEPKMTYSPDGTRVDISFIVQPGIRSHVEHIVISGLVHAHEEVVRRELTFGEGDPLSPEKIFESQRRLGALGLFRGVGIRELSPEARTHVTLVVTVEEAPRTQLAYGLGAAGLGSEGNAVLRASAEVTRRNVGGLGRSVSLFARMSFRGSRFLARYGEPYLFGRKAALSLAAFREEEERTRFSYDRVGVSLETTRGFAENWNFVARYTYSQTQLNDVQVPKSEIDREFLNATFSGPSLSMLNDTRDDVLDPRRGRFLGADVHFSHAALGGNSFLKGFFQASVCQPITARVVLAVATRLGLAHTFLDEDLAPPDRFFAGGAYSLRGFKTDAVLAEGGRGLALGGVELRLFLTRALSLAVFSDLGNVFSEVADMSIQDLRYTTGIGVRYRTALGPLRLDWGYKLDGRSGESPSELHFTVGHAF